MNELSATFCARTSSPSPTAPTDRREHPALPRSRRAGRQRRHHQQHAGSGPHRRWRYREALAGEMGVDAANLQASIDAYNAAGEGGTDEFGFVADNTADAAMTEGPGTPAARCPPCTTPWAASA
ncbi:MAG: hypothetical protein ACLUE1_04090 [Adlercreutzia equolifaciens]